MTTWTDWENPTLEEAEAQAMISLIRDRLPVHVAGGVEEF